jgi:hypothetical protein
MCELLPPTSIMPLPLPLLPMLALGTTAPFFCRRHRSRPLLLPPPPLLLVPPLGFPFPCSNSHQWSLPLQPPPPRRRCWSLPLPLYVASGAFPCSRRHRLHSVTLLHFPRRRNTSTSSCALPPKRRLTDTLKTMDKSFAPYSSIKKTNTIVFKQTYHNKF